jgi:hypothetical protein
LCAYCYTSKFCALDFGPLNFYVTTFYTSKFHVTDFLHTEILPDPPKSLIFQILDLLTTHLNLEIQPIWRQATTANYDYIFDDLRSNQTDVYAYGFEESDKRKGDFEFTSHMYYVRFFLQKFGFI